MLFISSFSALGLLHFTTLSYTVKVKHSYKECSAKWSDWIVGKDHLISNIPNVTTTVVGQMCMWTNASCTRNRPCPCEAYYSAKLSDIRLPRKRNHVCVQKKSCDVLICSSAVYSGSTIDSKKLVLKTFHIDGKQNNQKSLVGIIYMPLDYDTWKSYKKAELQTEQVSQVESETYVVIKDLQSPISSVNAQSSYLPLFSHKNVNKTRYILIFIGFVLFSLLLSILVVFVAKTFHYTCCFTGLLDRKYSTKDFNLAGEG
ncbi:unnamed protein product [Heterobilharzia americana]|nr:unnamed protein product [Heterobilharzia americana]